MHATAAVLDCAPDADVCLSGEAARLLGVASETVRLWADSGKVPCQRIGRVRVFRRVDLERVARERNRLAGTARQRVRALLVRASVLAAATKRRTSDPLSAER